MRRPLSNFAEIRDARDAFADWLTQIHGRVVGPSHGGIRRRFPDEEAFLKAMTECMQRRGLPLNERAPTARGFAYWLDGSHLPRQHWVDPLLDVLVDDTSDAHPERNEAWKLWNAADAEKNQASNTLRRPPARRSLLPDSTLDEPTRRIGLAG